MKVVKSALRVENYDQTSFANHVKLAQGNFGEVYIGSIVDVELQNEFNLLRITEGAAVTFNQNSIPHAVAIKRPLGEVNEKVIKDYKKEGNVVNYIYEYCRFHEKLDKPRFNIGVGIVEGNVPIVVSRFEGEGIASGSAESFVGKLNRNARQEDVPIFVAQIISSQYAAIDEVHKAGVLHLDIANRNFLIRKPREDEKQNSNIINVAVVLADFGMSKIRKENLATPVTFKREQVPYKWMNKEAIIERKVSPKTDLYAMKTTVLESLTQICGHPSSKYLWDRNECERSIVGHSDAGRLAAQFEKLKDDANRDVPLYAPMIECYRLYITNVPYEANQHMSLEEYKNADRALLETCNAFFVRQQLAQYLLQSRDQTVINLLDERQQLSIKALNFDDDTALADFHLMVKRLMSINVGEMQNEEIYKLCKRFAAEESPDRELAKYIQMYTDANHKKWGALQRNPQNMNYSQNQTEQFTETTDWLWADNIMQPAMPTGVGIHHGIPDARDGLPQQQIDNHINNPDAYSLQQAKQQEVDKISSRRVQELSSAIKSKQPSRSNKEEILDAFNRVIESGVTKVKSLNIKEKFKSFISRDKKPNQSKTPTNDVQPENDVYLAIQVTSQERYDATKGRDEIHHQQTPDNDHPETDVYSAIRVNVQGESTSQQASDTLPVKDVYSAIPVASESDLAPIEQSQTNVVVNANTPQQTTQKKSSGFFAFFKNPLKEPTIDYVAIREFIAKTIRSIEQVDTENLTPKVCKKISEDLSKIEKKALRSEQAAQCRALIADLRAPGENKKMVLEKALVLLKENNSYTDGVKERMSPKP